MKKNKLLTSLMALALVASLGACETGDINVNIDVGGVEVNPNDSSLSEDTTTSDSGTGGDTGTSEGGEGGDGSGESRLGLLGEAFKLVGGANYTLTCYSTAVNTDDHLSYKGVVTSVGAISTSYTGSTTGMINDPDDGGFVEVTLDGDLLKASAAPDPTRSVQDYYISSNIDTALFEELEDGRFALKDEGFTSDVLQDLFPDKPFTGGLITPTQGTIFIEVEDDLSKVTYYYDSSFLGSYTVTLVVENLGTTVFPYDLSTQYVGVGSEEVTTWATFLDSTLKASVDELLGADLDDVLPFFVPDGGYSYTGIWSGKFNLTYSGNADVWVEPLLEFGYVEISANAEYLFVGEVYNYTVTLSSFFGNTDLYLAPTEKPAEESDADIISAILEACEDGLDWTAFHGEYTDESSDEYIEAYLTTDTNGNLYGSVLEYEDGELFWEYYYVDGVEYSHGLTYDNYFTEDDSDYFEYESFEDALDEFGCGFESFLDSSYEDRSDWLLVVDGDIYTLTIPGTYSDSVTCSREEDTYTVLSVNETYEGTYPFYAGEVSFAESTSKETVDNALLGFDATLWGEGETTIADAISEFEDRGSDYNYGDGFSYQSIDYSSSYYYNTECVATSDDNGYYIAESSWDETYYAYGAYSNGSNTWSYDSDNGCEDVGYLYFSYTLFTLQTVMSFAYTDFDEIIEGLTSFVGSDLDTDVLVTDQLIYVWTSNEDEEEAVLYAEYENNALSLLVYEYAGSTSARAVMLTPYEGTIDVPEWVEIDEGEGENPGETYEGDPVADLLSNVKENNNYTLTIEYNDWTSPTYGSEDEMYQDFYNGTISQNSQRHYMIDITFTEDVMFIEYYYGTNDGNVYDIESYINNGDDMDVYWCTGTYSTTLAKQEEMTESSQSWQTKWENETLLGLDDNLFSVDASSYDGSKVDYTATIDSYGTLTALVDCLYHCANYYAEGSYASNITPFIYNLETYWNTYGAPYVDSTYYFATQEWVTTTYYLEESVTPTGSGNDYQLKYHGVTAYISNVGSTQLADIYASQLPIYSN